MSALYSAILDSNRGGHYHDTGRHAGHDCYILHRRCLHQTKRGAIEQLSAFHYQALRVDSYTVVVKYVRTDVVIKKLVTQGAVKIYPGETRSGSTVVILIETGKISGR